MNFNGHNTPTYTNDSTITYPDSQRYPGYIYDEVKYCPFCGKKLPESNQMISFCPYCGHEIPRTTTNGMFVFHWNYGDGTASWPNGGIINPTITCGGN